MSHFGTEPGPHKKWNCESGQADRECSILWSSCCCCCQQISVSDITNVKSYFLLSFVVRVIICIERFHSRGQHLCKFVGTRESVCIRKEFNFQRTGLGHQHGRRFIVWDTNMAAVTSCENTPYFSYNGRPLTIVTLEKFFYILAMRGHGLVY